LTGQAIAPSSGFQDYFYPEPVAKRRIVLHFTAGVLTGDLGVLMNQERGYVSVAYVVSRGGTVYRLFDPAHWSFHLGPKAEGGNKTQSRLSIGIEISNLGPLTLKGNELYTYFAKAYTTLDHKEHYAVLDKPYRGYSHYASYTPQQINAVIVLLRYLTATCKIPRAFLPEAKRFETTSEVTSFNGIVSHVNFRTDKFDLGPAFPWDDVINGVTAPVYVSTTPLGRSAPMVVESEAALDRGFVPAGDRQFDPNQFGEDGPPVAEIDSLQPS
jgi:N-acetyl-anhydromuramyl-L-alanine amidase AmpD